VQNRLIQTSQTGGQQYSDTPPFSIHCTKGSKPAGPFYFINGCVAAAAYIRFNFVHLVLIFVKEAIIEIYG
jgi:hypothetical protein